MFDMIAEVVIGLLKSLYGLSASVVSAVVNTVVTGKLIVRQTGGTAGTDEVQIYSSGSTDQFVDAMGGHLNIRTVAVKDIKLTPNAGNIICASGASLFIGGSAQALSGSGTGVITSTTGGWIQNTAGEKRRTATQTVTDTTTLAADDTLSITVISGRKYRFLLEYFFTTVNSSGVKVDLNGGSAGMTAINGMAFLYSSAGAVSNALQVTALTSSPALTATGTFAYVTISGSFQPSGNGTFVPRFAQNAETGAAESVIAQIGSYLTLADVP